MPINPLFYEAEFHNQNAKLIPVLIKTITRLEELPAIAFTVGTVGEEDDTVVHYDIVLDMPEFDCWRGNRTFINIGRRFEHTLTLLKMDLRCTTVERETVAERVDSAMTSMYSYMATHEPRIGYPRFDVGMSVTVPLPKGAQLTITSFRKHAKPDEDRTSLIATGVAAFFGEVRCWEITHQHAEDFTFTADNTVLAEAYTALFKAFPFFEGHVTLDNCKVIRCKNVLKYRE